MKLGDDVQHDKAVFCGSSKNEWRGYLLRGQYCAKKLFNYTRSCMETGHSFLVAQDGSGGFVSVTESVICHFKVRNCLVTMKQVMNLSPSLPEFVEQHQIFNCDDACPITSSHPAHMLEKCLTWLEYQPEANEYNVCTPRQLRTLAARKCLQSLKQRTLMGILPSVNCGDIQNCIQFSNVNVHV